MWQLSEAIQRRPKAVKQWLGKDGRVAARDGRREWGKRDSDIFMVYH